jgi:hypothetical protein
MSYDNTNSGALFKNQRKEGIATNPDYTGELDVGGVKYWVNSWIKTSKAGQKYMSLSVKPKTDAVTREPQPRGTVPAEDGIAF